MEANRGRDREDSKGMMAQMNATMDANLAEMKADRRVYHEQMMAMLDAYYERMMACLRKIEADTEKTEPDPGMMHSTEEHEEIPKGESRSDAGRRSDEAA
jgi:hypothetical protein